MARYTVAMDLESWREGQRTRRKTRTKKVRVRREVVREPRREGREARREGREPRIVREPVPARPELEVARPMNRRDGKVARGGRGFQGDEPLEGELEAVDASEIDTGEEPAELAAPEEDLGAERGLRGGLRDWQRPVALGDHMRVQTRQGVRAAVIPVKPGLYVVAEVPTQSVEFGFGPMLLGPALIKTLGRALQGPRSAGGAGRAHRPELSTQAAPKQLPGPSTELTEGQLAPWLDPDVAAELGAFAPRGRRSP